MAFLAFGVLSLAIAGCTGERSSPSARTGDAAPAEFTVIVSGGNATLPPPGHFDWEVVVRHGNGDVAYWPDYDRDKNPVWRYHFPATDAFVDSLWTAATVSTLWKGDARSDGAVGGGYRRLQLSDGRRRIAMNASTHAGRPESAAFASRVTALIPDSVWKRFSDSLDTWIDDASRRKAAESR